MNVKIVVVACVLSAVIGGVITRQYMPTEVTKTETKIQDHTVVVTHEVVKPDGSKVIDSTETSNTTTIAKQEQIKSASPPQWKGSAGMTLFGDKYYQVDLERRVLGPVFLGAFGNTKNEYGVSVGFEF